MEKEFKEMLKNLKEMLEMVINEDTEKNKEKFNNMMSEAIKQPCKITIEKDKRGQVKLGAEGNRVALLITLAGAEQGILKQLSCEQKEFDFIKGFVGSKEVD